MSTRYGEPKSVPDDVLADRLDDLSDYIAQGCKQGCSEFSMRIPAEVDRDADIVIAEAARRIRIIGDSAGSREALQHAGQGEAVVEIHRNEAGQILLRNPDGSSFDMSKHIGKTLYTRPQPAVPEGWKTASEMRRESYEGWCWIVYKGRVTEAYRDHKYRYLFGRHSQNVYLSECITHVMPWPYPAPPLSAAKGE